MIPRPDDLEGAAEGRRRRDEALGLLAETRALLVRRVQRCFLTLLTDRGKATIDPVRDLVPIPKEIDARLVGAAVRQLAELGMIHRAGLSRSVRPEAHGRDLPIWGIIDRGAVLGWLATHSDEPDPAPAVRQLEMLAMD
jgi:hypothetical protein